MSDSDNTSPIRAGLNLEASAKAELSVSAEIPPESTGRFIDALTDILRPFSERRGLKADLIRLQRAQVALKVAELASEKAMLRGDTIQPVPLKILVPLLESASLEESSDEALKKLWADLLHAAGTSSNVQPRYIGILRELTGEQANVFREICRGELWGIDRAQSLAHLEDVSYLMQAQEFERDVRAKFWEYYEGDSWFDAILDFISRSIASPGITNSYSAVEVADEMYELPEKSETRHPNSLDLQVLTSLGLLSSEACEFLIESPEIESINVSCRYYRITLLGFELFRVLDG